MKILIGLDTEFDNGLSDQLQKLRGQTFVGYNDKPFKLETISYAPSCGKTRDNWKQWFFCTTSEKRFSIFAQKDVTDVFPSTLDVMCNLSDDLNDAVMFLAKKYCHKHGVDK
nr:MAG TPA: hypothetical protein [Caudoviricetes sp.]